jgi:hypothetical protein
MKIKSYSYSYRYSYSHIIKSGDTEPQLATNWKYGR